MIPEFPSFKKLELADKKEVEKIISKFPPYSDFNFISMWIWNVSNDMSISQLNKNLVVIFNDYITGEPFVSFIGKNKISDTTSKLIKFSKEKHNLPHLKLISEEMVDGLKQAGFLVTPDTNSHDYVYSISHMANMDKWPQNSSGKKIRQFLKRCSDFVVKKSSIDEIDHEEHKEMFKRWAKNKNITDHFSLNEYKAFERLLQIKDKNIKVISLYIKNTLVGFTVSEILSDNYAMSHFAKADIKFDSAAYDLLNWEEAKILKEAGVKYYNWQQDLGIQGLRHSKIKYKPGFLLKQFIVSNAKLE